jgi:Avidin family
MRRVLCLLLVTIAVLVPGGLALTQTSTPTPTTPNATTPSQTTRGQATPTPSSPAGTIETVPTGHSVWTSQDGSTVDMTIDAASGAISGTFVPGFACGPSNAQTARPIVGTALGNALTWTLTLSSCPSVGTWIGHFQTVGAEQQLTMLLTLALPESPPGVGSTLTSSTVFVRQSQ